MSADRTKRPLGRVDAAVYRAERWVAGSLFLLMALVMFASVMHRIFSRQDSKLAALVKWAVGVELRGDAPTVALLAVVFVLAWGALRTMKPIARLGALSGGKVALAAAGMTAVLALFVKCLLWVFPNGLVWAPAICLSCMLWVGFLGASIATYERRHLALEMGEKLWPRSLARHVRALAMLTACGMALFLLALSGLSIADHHRTWAVNHLAGNLLPTAIPKWAVFLIFPYTFAVMGLRFLGQACRAASGSEGGDTGGEQPS